MNRKRVSLKDVAELAGVSYQTVSKVLNGQVHASPETLQRIQSAAQKLGYRPNRQARSLRTQRSHMIGYSWEPPQAGQANFILDLFLTSMVEEAEAAGYHLLPFPYREGSSQIQSYQNLIDAGYVDGFVLTSVNYGDARARFLTEQGFPFVAFGRASAGLDFPWVDVDGAAGLRLATAHLIERGHPRIAALAWPADSRVGNDRLEGYLAALRAAGRTAPPEWIARGEGTFAFAYAATRRWLEAEAAQRPTAVVAMNDTMAIGALHAAQALGLRVPQDLAVIGFDDAPMAEFLWPPLTSIRQPIREAGRKCVELLIKTMDGQALAKHQVLLQPELIVRASA